VARQATDRRTGEAADAEQRSDTVIPLPGLGRGQVKLVTGQETRIESVRQWSGLIAEQVSGWGSLIMGGIGMIVASIAPETVTSHPIEFCMIGAGILSGKKLAGMLKAALSVSP
jgi:hypothetical protein